MWELLTSPLISKDNAEPPLLPSDSIYIKGPLAHFFPSWFLTSRQDNWGLFVSSWSFASLWPSCLGDTHLIRHLLLVDSESLIYISPQ